MLMQAGNAGLDPCVLPDAVGKVAIASRRPRVTTSAID